MGTVSLAAGASLVWGLADFLGGVWARRLPVRVVLASSKVAAFVATAAVVGVLATPFPRDPRMWYAVAAGLVGVLGMGMLYLAVRHGPLVVVAPVAAGAALVPVAWGTARGEHLGGVGVAGVGVALVGITLAGLPRRRVGRIRIQSGSGPSYATAPYAAVAALALGTYFVLLHAAGTADPLWATAVARGVGALGALAVLAVPLRRHRADEPLGPQHADEPLGTLPADGLGRRPLSVAAVLGIGLIGVLDASGDAAFATSSLAGGLGAAAVLASLYPAVTVLLATTLLAERIRAVQAVGVAAALAGAALVSGAG